MIDIHSHLIFGVDDGPSSIKESVRMILEAERLGVKAVIATPHFRDDPMHITKVIQNYNEIVDRTRNFDIKIYLGSEVFINSLLPLENTDKSHMVLNNSRYLLFELPLENYPIYANEILSGLHSERIIPIIAHPERNRYFAKNFTTFVKFLEAGCLVQIDAASIVGVYGSEAKEFTKKLVKYNLVHFVASDAHCSSDYIQWYQQAYNQVKKWGGEDIANKLFIANPGIIQENTGGISMKEESQL